MYTCGGHRINSLAMLQGQELCYTFPYAAMPDPVLENLLESWMLWWQCRPEIPAPQEADAGRLEVQVLPGLHSEFKSGLGKLERTPRPQPIS